MKHSEACFQPTYVAESSSLADICREVNDIGFDVSQSTVHYVLHNRFYLGELPVKGTNKNRVDAWVPGTHSPMIATDVFDRASASLERNRRGRTTVRSGARTYTLTGICACGRCGSALHCDTVKGRSRLHCYRRWKRRDCDQPTTQLEPIQMQIVQHVHAMRPSDDEIPRLLQRVAGEPQDLTAKRQSLQRKMQRLRDLYLRTEDLTLADYEHRKRDIERELCLLEPVDDATVVTQELLRYLTSFDAWWDDASDEERNAMLRHILSTVVVDGGVVTSLGLVPEADCLLSARLSLSPPERDISSQAGSARA